MLHLRIEQHDVWRQFRTTRAHSARAPQRAGGREVFLLTSLSLDHTLARSIVNGASGSILAVARIEIEGTHPSALYSNDCRSCIAVLNCERLSWIKPGTQSRLRTASVKVQNDNLAW